MKKLKVLDFWAEWCGPCRTLKPIFEEISELKQDSIEFIKVDVDDDKNIDLVSKHGIRNIPTVLIIKDGEVVERIVGLKSKSDLLSIIESHE